MNYSIGIARNLIDSERTPRISTPINNPVYIALEEVANNVEVIEAKKVYVPVVKEPVKTEPEEKEEGTEEKPKRKILKNLRTLDKSL